ncbi:MAG: AraC family transcriptional regulator [Chroococcus sp. CMT-3BRIN-NPC107]|jgi:AraC family transcriptional regulator|nr:AraC family transcriptional regulator [Chroococcus sp. CMT-3BRIN-NPC107]
MTNEKLLILDAASDRSFSKISPSVPMLFNQTSFWGGIKLRYYQHPNDFETPKHCFLQHFMTIHLNRVAVIKEQTLDGHRRYDSFRDGDICLTPAHTPVSVRLKDACELICLSLEPALMTQITEFEDFELVPQFKLNDPLLYQIGMALKTTLEFTGKCDRLYTEAMATAISAHLLQHYSTKKPKIVTCKGLSQAQLRQVTAYITEHSAQNLSLLAMAEIVQMSPFYFSRLFKQSTGSTPHQYLLRYRTERAKQLLKTTNLSIAAIANRVGFADQSHLNRHFKRYVGMPPSQFRAG